MTDAEAIKIAEQYSKRHGLPIVSIPPAGVVDEVITVDFRTYKPTVTRRPRDVVGGAR